MAGVDGEFRVMENDSRVPVLVVCRVCRDLKGGLAVVKEVAGGYRNAPGSKRDCIHRSVLNVSVDHRPREPTPSREVVSRPPYSDGQALFGFSSVNRPWSRPAGTTESVAARRHLA